MIAITSAGKNRLAALLAEHYPGRKNLSITNIEEITDGWETQIFSFQLHYEEGGVGGSEALIVRFYEGTAQNRQAMKEYRVMSRVARWGLPVPQLKLLVTDDPSFEAAFIIMEKIAGATLADALQGASEEEVLRLMKSMVTHFVRLHEIAPQQVFADGLHQQTSTPVDFVKTQLAEMQTTIARFHLAEFEPFMRWLEEHAALGASPRLSVLHNDFHPGNILLDPSSGELSIIDWSFTEVGDYRLDLAWSVLLFGVMVGSQYRQAMLQAYEEISGERVEHFEYFEVLKLSQRMLTIATWLDESVEIPVKKITREAMRGDYKIHVLNVYERLKAVTGYTLPSVENL